VAWGEWRAERGLASKLLASVAHARGAGVSCGVCVACVCLALAMCLSRELRRRGGIHTIHGAHVDSHTPPTTPTTNILCAPHQHR
jgi:hypothetical protein